MGAGGAPARVVGAGRRMQRLPFLLLSLQPGLPIGDTFIVLPLTLRVSSPTSALPLLLLLPAAETGEGSLVVVGPWVDVEVEANLTV